MQPMEASRHLELLRTEGDRLASVPAELLDAPVPSLPDWTVERALRHTGKIHQWVAAVLAAGPDADGGAISADIPGVGEGTAALADYRMALDGVIAELERLDPSEPTWGFAGPADVSFWCRRQAHEVAMHRMDAADAIEAAGGPTPEPFAVDGAADGIDEWATLFLATRWQQNNGDFPTDLLGRTIHIHGTDDPPPADGAEWLLSFGVEGLDVATTHAKGDTALRGSAQDLLLTLWRRRSLDTVEVIGDRDLPERVLDIARF